jgi:hypothetical protein
MSENHTQYHPMIKYDPLVQELRDWLASRGLSLEVGRHNAMYLIQPDKPFSPPREIRLGFSVRPPASPQEVTHKETLDTFA